MHWSIPDPFRGWEADNADLNNFRQTRDIIKDHINQFMKNLEKK